MLRKRATGNWRKLHNEKLRDSYYSPNIMRVRLAGHVERVSGKEKYTLGLGEITEGKGPLGRPRST